MTRLHCPHCGRQTGHVERDQLVFWGDGPGYWENDPVSLWPLPCSWACRHCRREVWLNQAPTGRRVILDTKHMG